MVIPCLGTGGMERVMATIANYLHQCSSVDLLLIVYGKSREIFYPLSRGLKVEYPEFEFKEKNRLYSTIKTGFYLRESVKKYCPNVILSFGEYWNSFVILSLFGLNCNIIISDRCKPSKRLGLLHDILRYILYNMSAGIIVQTKIAHKIYSRYFASSKIHIIGNPIRRIVAGKGIKREKIVLSVGRLIDTKHHNELIKLFVSIKQNGWRLVIVGGDAIKQKNMVVLNSLIDDLEARDIVKLAGNIADVDEYYKSSEIFAFTSSSEGFPNAIGEAMSAGLPVVAFDCIAGPSDMVTDGVDGYLVPVFDYDIFKQKLMLLMSEEDLRKKMGNAAAVNIQKYSADHVCKKYYDLLVTKAL